MSLKKEGKKKWIVIAATVVVVGVLVACVFSATKKQEVVVNGTVAMIEKRTIANSITGNGTVESASKEDVTGGSMGMEVKSVNVEVGDVVGIGTVICVFDTTDLETRLEDLKEQLADTEERRNEQNEDYDKQQIDAVTSQQSRLTNLTTDLNEAKAELKVAKSDLEKTQKEYDAAKKAAEEDPLRGSLSLQDEMSYRSLITTQQSAVSSAQMDVNSIQSQIDILLEQDNTTYVTAKENYNEQTDSTVESLNDQIKEYEKQINEATVRANMTGIVTSVNVTEGTTFTGGVIATIETTDEFVVEAQIEEYDIPDIATGMKVLVKTDATRDQELEGVVSYIAPRATNSGSTSAGGFTSLMSGMDTSSFSSGSGSATYLIKISLLEPNDRLRLGMNAKVSVLTEERVDTWSVPYDAVYTREDGTTYVEKVVGKEEDGSILTEEMNVELGIQGSYYVEVISNNIKEGTQILIPDAQGNSSIEELLNMMGADAGI